MDAFSNYYENMIINHMLRGQAFTPPSTIYLALFKSATGLEENTGVTGEVSGGGYVRKAITLGAPSSGVSSNSASIEWSSITANWGTITHIAIVDHLSNLSFGSNVNVLVWGALTTPIAVNSGDILRLPEGLLSLSVY